jgi:hypothetical protein
VYDVDMTFTPTAEQEFATGEDLAGAGTGKSSTLRLLAEDAQQDGREGVAVTREPSGNWT